MNETTKSNMEINKAENLVAVSVNPKIFPLEVIYSAAYAFLDKAYIIIDGDPEEEITIELKPKEKGSDPGILGREFNNELLNYSAYSVQAEKNAAIRQMMIQRALFTNDNELEKMFGAESKDASYEDDPEGIAVPWEEKFGEKNEKPKQE